MKYFLICLLLLFSAGAIAQGKGHGKGKGHHHKHHLKKNESLPRGSSKRQGKLPPGLAKKITLPPGIAKRFTSDFPSATKISWSKRKGNYVAKYYANDYWTTTTYTPDVKIVETKTFIPVARAPQPVLIYKRSNPAVVIREVVRLELPNKEPVYQMRIEHGKYVYVNEAGLSVNF